MSNLHLPRLANLYAFCRFGEAEPGSGLNLQENLSNESTREKVFWSCFLSAHFQLDKRDVGVLSAGLYAQSARENTSFLATTLSLYVETA